MTGVETTMRFVLAEQVVKGDVLANVGTVIGVDPLTEAFVRLTVFTSRWVWTEGVNVPTTEVLLFHVTDELVLYYT